MAFGGGAGLDASGFLTSPSYTIQGVSFSDVGSAFGAVDSTLTNINNNGTKYYQSNSTGPGASATGTDALAMGSNTQSSGTNSIAIGTNAQATQAGSIAMGFGAASTGANAIAIGTGALATGSVAVGNGASAANGGAAFGDFSVATGGISGVSSATAVGNSASATTANAVAVGQSSSVQAANGTAIGGGATVMTAAVNSVAIGQGSVATAPNTVSFGTAGSPRVLTNVAPGVGPNDAATFGQLSSVASGIQGQIGGLQSQINNNQTESRRGIAAAVATANAPMPSAPGRLSYQVRASTFEGQTGFGLSLAYRLNTTVPIAVVGGYGSGGGVENTGHVGLQGEF